MALSVIQEITSMVYRIAVSRQKQRRHLLLYGCACKIQTLVRRFLRRNVRLSFRSGNQTSNKSSNNIRKLRRQAKRPVMSIAEETQRCAA